MRQVVFTVRFTNPPVPRFMAFASYNSCEWKKHLYTVNGRMAPGGRFERRQAVQRFGESRCYLLENRTGVEDIRKRTGSHRNTLTSRSRSIIMCNGCKFSH